MYSARSCTNSWLNPSGLFANSQRVVLISCGYVVCATLVSPVLITRTITDRIAVENFTASFRTTPGVPSWVGPSASRTAFHRVRNLVPAFAALGSLHRSVRFPPEDLLAPSEERARSSVRRCSNTRPPQLSSRRRSRQFVHCHLDCNIILGVDLIEAGKLHNGVRGLNVKAPQLGPVVGFQHGMDKARHRRQHRALRDAGTPEDHSAA